MFELKHQNNKSYLMICGWYDSLVSVLDLQTHEVTLQKQISDSKLNRDMCRVSSSDSSFAVALSKGFVLIKYKRSGGDL